MNLSDAIYRRDEMVKELEKLDEWMYKGRSDGSIPDIKKLRTALSVLGEQMNRDIQELTEKIEDAIKGMTIDTVKSRPDYISDDKEPTFFQYKIWTDGYPFKLYRTYEGYIFNEKWVCINNALYLAEAFSWKGKQRESEA